MTLGKIAGWLYNHQIIQRGQREDRNCGSRISVISKPIAKRVTGRRWQVRYYSIRKGWGHGSVKKRDCQSAKQQHARPIEYGLHGATMCRNLRPCKPWQVRFRAAFALVMLAALTGGCGDRVPEGQVLVVLGETEVTMRELQEALKGGALDAASQDAALEALVTRKILSEEAERRGLESSGEFHFALREARQALLVRALRSDIDQSISLDLDAAVEREVSAYPWRYANRFVATLQRENSADDLVVVDSANFDRLPPATLLRAGRGDVIALDGVRWTVVARRIVNVSPAEQRAQAVQLLRQRAIDAEIEEMLENYRQRGLIRYQKGWGAAAEGTR